MFTTLVTYGILLFIAYYLRDVLFKVVGFLLAAAAAGFVWLFVTGVTGIPLLGFIAGVCAIYVFMSKVKPWLEKKIKPLLGSGGGGAHH